MPVDDVPDSTDWLATPLSGLSAVEAALRCQVCKDFYKTPMITSCSHTFCSLCIRRALSNDGQCPLCRAPEQEMKLRSNWSVEEAVEAFTRARSDVLGVARDTLPPSPPGKRKADICASPATSPKRPRTSQRLRKTRAGAAIASSAVTTHKEIAESPEDNEEYLPDGADRPVPCPACQQMMKAAQVFNHLEACPGLSGPPQSKDTYSPVSSLNQHRQRQDRSHERLPALNYTMLKEPALRKKMTELGLSGQGPRALLERRHKEWLTLWNANCDAALPKKRCELLHDLDVWERTQGGKAPTAGRSFQTAAAIKDKDFDGAAWAVKHDTSFKDLIASAKKSKTNAIPGAQKGDQRPAPESEEKTDVRPLITESHPSGPSLPLRHEADTWDGELLDGTGLSPPQPDVAQAATSTSPSTTVEMTLAAALPCHMPDDFILGGRDAADWHGG